MAKSTLSLALLCLSVMLISSFNFGEVTANDPVPIYNDQKAWCVAKPSSSDDELGRNIDYVCRQVGLDCSKIQPGGQCFYPNNLSNHASVVMNMYFQRFGRNLHNCDFSNSAIIASTDPSYGSCQYSYA